MKKQLNEQFTRMQKLAGIITENIENIKEDESSPYYKLGYQIGPNGRRATVDTQSIEYNTIEEKANQLTSLLNNKDLIDFAKGSTDSIGSSRARYEGLQDVASSLLFFNEIKNRLGESKLNKNQINEESYRADKMLELLQIVLDDSKKMVADKTEDEGFIIMYLQNTIKGVIDIMKGSNKTNENQITEDQSDSLLTLVKDYKDYTYAAYQGYGIVNVDGKEMKQTKYAALQLEKIKPEIIKLKGEQYFEDVHDFANLSTVAEEYSGEDLTDELEAAALKLGFSLEDLT